eukprot:1122743-Pelagomonas_calceolata.AAC.1
MGIWRVAHHAPGCPDSPSPVLRRLAPSKIPQKPPRKQRAGYKSKKTSHEQFQTVFPNGTGSSAQHQGYPDALFVRPIPGRQAHLDSSKIHNCVP